MTQVYAERDGQRCILSAQGHATGSVEACAAVSGILYALAGYVTNAMRERYVEVYTWRMESGDVQLDFDGDDGTAAAFEMAVIGLAQVAQAHPEPGRKIKIFSEFGAKSGKAFDTLILSSCFTPCGAAVTVGTGPLPW